ncbi:hypothetical protein [Pseudomonas delhiensis]|uniref:hypothetical protein n=1 Tax=Pseudomonas delhiensis TaxID=366289 RepID=UPI00315AB4C7
MEFSAHAIQRCSQRGIRQQQVQWILDFGCHTWNRGAHAYFFDQAHFQRLLLKPSATDRQLAEKARSAYVGGQGWLGDYRWGVFCASKPGNFRRVDWRHGEQRVA